MKEGIHPKYREVVIKDISSDFMMITRSTKDSKDKITVEGKEYPVLMVEVSSASHPYYTGKQMLVDSAGRIDRFKSRYTEVVGAKRKTRATKEEAAPAKPAELSKTKQKKLAQAAKGSEPAAAAAPESEA